MNSKNLREYEKAVRKYAEVIDITEDCSNQELLFIIFNLMMHLVCDAKCDGKASYDTCLSKIRGFVSHLPEFAAMMEKARESCDEGPGPMPWEVN